MTSVVSKTLFCLLMLHAAFGYAHNDRAKQQLSGAAIQQHVILQVEDSRVPEMQTGVFSFTNVKVIDEIMLLIDLKSNTPSADFTTTVNLNVEYDEWDGTQFITKSKIIALTVN